MTDELIGWKRIADYLRVSVVTAWKYRKEGGLPIIQFYTGKVRASKIELEAWKKLQGSESKEKLS